MNGTTVTFNVKDYDIVEENGELVRKEKSKDVEFIIDPSLNAETRFEANFPIIYEKGEDLLQYTKRIHENLEKSYEKNKTLSMSEIGILVKIVYCWLDTEIPYKEFVKLFTLADINEQKKVTDKFLKIIRLVFNGSAEKN